LRHVHPERFRVTAPECRLQRPAAGRLGTSRCESVAGCKMIQGRSTPTVLTLDAAAKCRTDSSRNFTLAPQVHRPVGPEQVTPFNSLPAGDHRRACRGKAFLLAS